MNILRLLSVGGGGDRGRRKKKRSSGIGQAGNFPQNVCPGENLGLAAIGGAFCQPLRDGADRGLALRTFRSAKPDRARGSPAKHISRNNFLVPRLDKQQKVQMKPIDSYSLHFDCFNTYTTP